MQSDLGGTSCTQIVNQARNKRFLIFDPSTKTWFTPEEFQDKFGKHSGFEDFFAQCQVRDPQDGVQAAMKQAQQTQDRLTAFVNKVLEYYRQH
jgi:hypothetical protein